MWDGEAQLSGVKWTSIIQWFFLKSSLNDNITLKKREHMIRAQSNYPSTDLYMLSFIVTSVLVPIFFLKLIYLFLFSYNCLCFLPFPPPTPASPTSLPYLYPPPWFCPCVLYSSSYRPLSTLSPPHSPVAIVTMFLISMSLVIFCLFFSFIDYVPVKGEIIWYLSLTAWLISLSIMLSSSIHAIAKDISSFFLSAA